MNFRLLGVRPQHPLLLSGLFWSTASYDEPVAVDLEKLYQDRAQLSIRQRLELLMTVDQQGNFSPELSEAANLTFSSSVMAFMLTGSLNSRDATAKFIAENKHAMFRNPREAQYAVADQAILSFVRSGLAVGWRVFLFAGMLSFGTCLAKVIRNDINPLDHTAVGFLAGALYRLNRGPRPMLGAGAVGAMLGLLYGCSEWLSCRLSNTSLEKKWLLRYQALAQKRNLQLEQLREAQNEVIVRPWSAHHDDEAAPLQTKHSWLLSRVRHWLIKNE